MPHDVNALLDALGHPARRRIVGRLASGPLAVGQIAQGMPMGRPAVSMHLSVLKSAGLIAGQARGNRRLYYLQPEALQRLRDHLDWYWDRAIAAYQQTVEQKGGPEVDTPRPEITVHKTVTVRVPLAVAFDVFIDLGWWPVATHHLAQPAGSRLVLEPFVGGRWYELGPDGTETDWGTVLVFEPPHHLLVTWQFTPDWTYEPDPAHASEIDLRFTAQGPASTRVDHLHRHLERYGLAADRMHSIIDGPNGAGQPLAAYARATRHKHAGKPRAFKTGAPT